MNHMKRLLRRPPVFSRHSSAFASLSTAHPPRFPPDNALSPSKRLSSPPSKTTRSLTQMVAALQHFQGLEGHFAVPFSFVVPSSGRWPSDLHYLPLGVKVHRLMQSVAKGNTSSLEKSQQLQKLQRMGFPLTNWQQYQFQEVMLPALRNYAEQYGGLFVPQKFVVPEGDKAEAEGWPKATWGYKLGMAVSKVRKQRQQNKSQSAALLPPLPKEQVDALNEIGFVWHVRDAKWHQFFLPGLRKYRELYGDADVPMAFVVPSHEEDPRWPKLLEDYMLGRHVYMIRAGGYAPQARDSRKELEELGFSFKLAETTWSDSIFPALKLFAKEFGHCDVAQDFVVPSNAPWPENLWGIKLGDTVKNIRRGAYEVQVNAHRKELEALGFVWDARHRVKKTVLSVVLPAIVTYQQLHGTDSFVTTDFVVPERDPNWPPLTRGFKLGQWITRVRSGQVPLPSSLRKELDAIGFVWRSNDQRWNEVLLPAFRVYAELHGGTCAAMSTKFYVPPEAPYPRAAWGANLGGALWHIRNGDSYVNNEDKQQVLRDLGVLLDGDK